MWFDRNCDQEAERDEDDASTEKEREVPPAGTHGFSWHYDDEDVFIA